MNDVTINGNQMNYYLDLNDLVREAVDGATLKIRVGKPRSYLLNGAPITAASVYGEIDEREFFLGRKEIK